MRSFRIGSVFGIPLKLDLTFLLVLPLFAYLIGAQTGYYVEILNGLSTAVAGVLPVTIPVLEPTVLAGGLTPFLLGLLAALGLFIGVVLHELGHSVVAMRYGVHIQSITLWLLGGVAQLESIPEDWHKEFYIAIAGPIVSILVGVGSFVLMVLAVTVLPGGTVGATAQFVLGYLALVNVILAGFNMLPGFPMDGGRVLRALLARTRSYARATQLAAEVGKGFAIVLGLLGLFGNLFLIVLAFFIYIAASGEAQQVMTKAAFEGVTVGDIMTPRERVSTIPAAASISDLVSLMFRERHTGYPVLREGTVVGLVTLEDARSVREVERDAYRVEEVMSTNLIGVGPETDVMEALTTMQSEGVGRLLVMRDGEFVGLLTRSDIMTALTIIQSSGSLGVRNRPTAAGTGGRPFEDPR